MNEGGGWRAAASRAAGRVARSPGSRWLIPWFAHHYHIRREEAVEPEGGFRNLQEFFCRARREEAAPAPPGMLVSPADGMVTACGAIASGQLVQAKGREYSVAGLLGDAARAPAFTGGWYATVYLAPADYHRVHAPAAGTVREARYVPGTRWPVNPRTAARVPELLARNERLITYLDTGDGEVAVVMVGACLVGGMRVNFDAGWNAGPGPHVADRRRYQPGVALARGQELGRFEFGSTVVVLAPAGVAAGLCVEAGERVRVGSALMRGAGPAGSGPPAGC